MLAEQLEYWGPGTFQQQLDHAYDDFIRYCRRNKLGHSQPPFKVSKVFWRSNLFLTVFERCRSVEVLKDIRGTKETSRYK